MKNDSSTTLLNFVLYVLVILCVGFAVWSMWRTRDLKDLTVAVQTQAQIVQAKSVTAQALLNDVIIYNNTVKSPELAQIIQSAQAAPQPAGK